MKIVDTIDVIKIEGADLRNYASIAFIVDNPKIVMDIWRARNTLNLFPPRSYDEVRNPWDHRKHFSDNKSINDKLNEIGDIETDFHKENREISLIEHEFSTLSYTRFLLSKWQLGISYLKVIYYAILTGVVRTSDVSPFASFWTVEQFRNESPTYLNPMDGVIVINRNTDFEYVKARFYEYQKALGTPDTITNIVRDRNWYWSHLGGTSYSKIHAAAIKNGDVVTESAVKKAIKRYEKLLAAGGLSYPNENSWIFSLDNHVPSELE